MQHGQIPANLHFNILNPAVEPFYRHLRIPTATEPWPVLPDGFRRRASVNSFGFGGTNAHAILESWSGDDEKHNGSTGHEGCLFVLSANSAQTLAMRKAQLRDYLSSNPEIDLGRLSRSLFLCPQFTFRAAFSASTAQQLAAKLDSSINIKSLRAMAIPESHPVRILAIITGQGAQWPTMGAGLYKSSAVFRRSFLCMQCSLDSLPDEKDRPTWTLLDELSAPAAQSRMGDASISQPLSTALQVALIDMLRVAGVQIAGIVGHSSGEVAAAYAAGYIDAHDAIRIAYLRGLHSHLAQGPDGEQGKMMAVGMSQDQAKAFCAEFNNEISLAACNSTRSCTLAGNASVIDAAREKLEAAGVFARVLQVDKAYHSNHMLPVAPPYLEALRKCKIRVYDNRKEEDITPWYSSVWGSGGRSRSFMDTHEARSLLGQYWADNMISPVLFAEAIQRSIEEGQVYDMILEIGPHPALKGPVSETVTNMTGVSLPYSGLLKRGATDVEAFNDSLGLLWQSFSLPGRQQLIGFDGMQQAFATGDEPRGPPALLHDLPSYPFNHDTIYWKESRASAMFRTQSQPRHKLLGHSTMFGSDGRRDVHWRQVLRLSEIPWLRGHRIQGEYLFPATAYVTMAYEAAVRLVPATQELERMEIRDIDIFRAINLEQDSPGTDIMFTMTVTDQSHSTITGRWACYSAPVDVERGYSLGDAPTQAKAHAEGQVLLFLGSPTRHALPKKTEPALPLSSIDVDELYTTLAAIGHEYTEHFQASAVLRRLHHAVVILPPAWDQADLLTRPDMNPAALDAAMHGLLAAYSYPGDGRQRSVYLPSRIDSISIDMMSPTEASPKLEADCFVTHADARRITGDMDVYDPISGEISVQLRGVHLSALPGSQLLDRELYAEEIWERDIQFGIEPGREACLDEDRLEVAQLAARLVIFYCRKLVGSQIKPYETILMSKNRKNLVEWVSNSLLPKVQAGLYAGTKGEWMNEESENLLDADIDVSGARDSAEAILIRAIGSNLPSITRGLTPALKVAENNGALDQFYANGVGFHEAINNTATIVAQISHRYPAMTIAQVGCSYGPGLQRAVLNKVGKRRYKSYTVTNALTSLDQDPKVLFRPLDMAKDAIAQGFTEGSYDLVIATTSYSTNISRETLGHARKLLRSGGFFILVAMTEDYLPVRFVLSLLPGSWLERDNGQPQIVTISECDLMLKDSGFSGVDKSYTSSFCSVMLSQAFDDSVVAIRNPMSLTQQLNVEDILLIHDETPSSGVSYLISEVKQRLEQRLGGGTVQTIAGLDGICIPPNCMVVNLCDLDNAVFSSSMQESHYRGLQDIVRHASSLLWITKGAQNGRVPNNSMVTGWARSARIERTSLRIQTLDIAQEAETLDPDMMVRLLLNLANYSEDEGTMWTLEPEFLLKDDALYIPRLQPIDEMNVLNDTRSKDVTVEVAATSQFIKLDERGQLTVERSYNSESQSPDWEILTSSVHRLLLQGQLEPKRLCTLRNPDSGETQLVLISPTATNAQGSGIQFVHRYDQNDDLKINYSHHLHHLIRAALAEATLSQVDGRVWVHGAPAWLVSELDLAVLRHPHIKLYQTTSNLERSDENVTFLHPFAMERDMALAMPRDALTLLCLDDTQQGASLMNLARKYRPNTQIQRLSLSLESHNGVLHANLSCAALTNLSQALAAHPSPVSTPVDEHIIAIQDIPNTNLSTASPVAVFDRTTTSTVTAKLLPPSYADLFSPNKTYLLVGLTGDIGIAISNWLFENGAHHVVLASRNPPMSQSVIDHAAAVYGADLRFMAVDICSQSSLSAAWAEIHSSMPPVAGIMNGAMIMHDQLFVDQSWADFSAVLAPKVTGTRNLVALLDKEDRAAQLDFMLLFSSAAASLGNAGQTAYAAAGCYMQGMATHLQSRGVAASAVHIGLVSGLGYVNRHERRKEIQQSVQNVYACVSETDLLDMLGEAITASRKPGSPIGIITGIRGDISQYSWRQQPRLWHYLKLDDDGGEAATKDDGTVSLQTRLAGVIGDDSACLELLLEHFGLALCAILHTKPEELETSMSVASLGIDSLVAVRVREWFMHHVRVEVSVLKIMSATVTQVELCKDVLAAWRKQTEK